MKRAVVLFFGALLLASCGVLSSRFHNYNTPTLIHTESSAWITFKNTLNLESPYITLEVEIKNSRYGEVSHVKVHSKHRDTGFRMMRFSDGKDNYVFSVMDLWGDEEIIIMDWQEFEKSPAETARLFKLMIEKRRANLSPPFYPSDLSDNPPERNPD